MLSGRGRTRATTNASATLTPVLGTILFTVTSVWYALAPDIGNLIGAWAAQDTGEAGLTSASLAPISATGACGTEPGRAIGRWSAGSVGPWALRRDG